MQQDPLSADPSIIADGRIVTIAFDAFRAETGSNSPGALRSSNCQINIQFNSDLLDLEPQADITTRGSSVIQDGIQGTLTTGAFFNGNNGQTFTDTINGPTQTNYTSTHHANGPISLGGRGSLNINLRNSINPASTDPNLQTIDTIDISLRGLLG
ncbi:DUF4360 domain-containing protein [Streptomyces sp. NPDC002104]